MKATPIGWYAKVKKLNCKSNFMCSNNVLILVWWELSSDADLQGCGSTVHCNVPAPLFSGRPGWDLWKSATSEGSRISATGTQHCSLGPYPSQSTKYCSLPTLRPELGSWYAGAPLTVINLGGSVGAERGPGITGLRRDTWKVGETCMEGGRERVNETRVTCQSIVKGPKKRKLSFLNGRQRRRSLAESHTLSPELFWGGSRRWRSACIWWRRMAWCVWTRVSTRTMELQTQTWEEQSHCYHGVSVQNECVTQNGGRVDFCDQCELRTENRLLSTSVSTPLAHASLPRTLLLIVVPLGCRQLPGRISTGEHFRGFTVTLGLDGSHTSLHEASTTKGLLESGRCRKGAKVKWPFKARLAACIHLSKSGFPGLAQAVSDTATGLILWMNLR